jgi:hypothetical protein
MRNEAFVKPGFSRRSGGQVSLEKNYHPACVLLLPFIMQDLSQL